MSKRLHINYILEYPKNINDNTSGERGDCIYREKKTMMRKKNWEFHIHVVNKKICGLLFCQKTKKTVTHGNIISLLLSFFQVR